MFSYILMILGVIFWIFRLVVAIAFSSSSNFIVQPINQNIEIVLLFAALPCFLLIFKRNIIGAAIYVGMYLSYFGTELYQLLSQGIMNINTMVAMIGVVLPIVIFLDILLNKNMRLVRRNKKTDWFYNTNDYERQLDERADKNQYKF